MLTQLREQFDYNHWANERALESSVRSRSALIS